MAAARQETKDGREGLHGMVALKEKRPKKEPPRRFRETSVVRSPWQHKTEEKEGGGEGTKAIATAAPTSN